MRDLCVTMGCLTTSLVPDMLTNDRFVMVRADELQFGPWLKMIDIDALGQVELRETVELRCRGKCDSHGGVDRCYEKELYYGCGPHPSFGLESTGVIIARIDDGY